MLVKVLSVAKPGTVGRKLIKNTENIVTCNTRLVCKPDQIYQELSGNDGFDVQNLSKFRIPMFYKGKKEFVDWFIDKMPE